MADTSDRNQAGDAPRQSFAALRHRGYRIYFVGAALAMMADNIEHVITYWIIFQKFHSPALGGFAIISHWLPFLLFSFHAGALADRFDPRRIIQAGMALFMIASLGWGLLFLTDTLEMWHAVVLLTIHGLAGVLWSPAAQLLVHDIVGRQHLQSAVRLMAISRTLGQMMGPAIGAMMLLAFGSAYGLVINAMIFLPLALWLIKAPYGPRFNKVGGSRPARAMRGLADILPSIRMVAGNQVLVSMILLAGTSSLIVGNGYQAQMPEFAHDLVQGDTGIYYSMLLGANAAGALLAGIVLESGGFLQPRIKTAFVLVMLWSITIGAFAVTTFYPLALVLILATGFFNLAFGTMAQTMVQLNAPHEIRGRVIGLYNMSHHGLRSFSGVTIGIGGSFIGIHWSLGLSAALLLVTTLSLMMLVTRATPAPAAE